jgi:hypothetical protein
LANQSALKFLKYLIAACAKYPVTAEVREVYLAKLSKWNMTQEQWDKALDMILESDHGGNLPELKEIYDALKNAGYHGKSDDGGNKGRLYFDWDGHSYCMRVYAEGGKWRIASLRGKDLHGQEIEMQKNVGDLVDEHIPQTAENIQVIPDRMANY